MQVSKTLGITFLFIAMGCTPNTPIVKKTHLISPTKSLLQAISIVDENTAWVSGHRATFLRTVNGGSDWSAFSYEPIDSLQFRDIHAFNSEEIILMSAGPGNLSRIFRFSLQAGFEETYVMPYEQGFLNTIEFWDDEQGLAFGDSFNGELFVLKTADGGRSWIRIDARQLPPAGEGEGGFAASGTCIASRPGGKAWIGTGAGGNSRIIFTSDYGDSWESYEAPLIKGPSAGITSIRMSDDQTGLIVGGDLAITDQYTDNIALTNDGGQTWQVTASPVTKGAFYGSDLMSWENASILIATGPNGMDYSTDLGRTYINLDTGNYWAVDLHPSGFGLAAGTDGKILKLTVQ